MDDLFCVVLYLLGGVFVAMIINAFARLSDPFYLFTGCALVSILICLAKDVVRINLKEKEDK